MTDSLFCTHKTWLSFGTGFSKYKLQTHVYIKMCQELVLQTEIHGMTRKELRKISTGGTRILITMANSALGIAPSVGSSL